MMPHLKLFASGTLQLTLNQLTHAFYQHLSCSGQLYLFQIYFQEELSLTLTHPYTFGMFQVHGTSRNHLTYLRL